MLLYSKAGPMRRTDGLRAVLGWTLYIYSYTFSTYILTDKPTTEKILQIISMRLRILLINRTILKTKSVGTILEPIHKKIYNLKI